MRQERNVTDRTDRTDLSDDDRFADQRTLLPADPSSGTAPRREAVQIVNSTDLSQQEQISSTRQTPIDTQARDFPRISMWTKKVRVRKSKHVAGCVLRRQSAFKLTVKIRGL